MIRTDNIFKLSIDDYDTLFDNADKLGVHDNVRLLTAIVDDVILENRCIIEAMEDLKDEEVLLLYYLREGMYIVWLTDKIHNKGCEGIGRCR